MDSQGSMDLQHSPSPPPRTYSLCENCLEKLPVEELERVQGAQRCAACRARSVPDGAARGEVHSVSAFHPTGPAPANFPPPSGRHGLLARLKDDAQDWCAQASWLPRLPLLALIAYWAVRHLSDTEYAGVMGGLNFGIHEFGHVLFSPFGQFLAIAGGSLSQCAAPLIGAAMFLRQRDYFAIAVALAWLGTNLFDVASYVADARTRTLPLVGLGSGEPLHDWNYLLGKLGLLRSDQTLAALLRLGGGLSFALALSGGGWLLIRMWRVERV